MIQHKNTIKDTIKVLESEIEAEQSILNDKINALNALKKLLPPKVELSNDGEEQTADNQIMSLFEDKIRYAVRRSELQALFEMEFNSNKNVGAGLPKLKRTGKLKMVRYNGQKGFSFWCLPSWIEGNDIKEGYKPAKNLLPEKIFKSEIVED